MGGQGIQLAVPEDQAGKLPKLVTEAEPLPVSVKGTVEKDDSHIQRTDDASTAELLNLIYTELRMQTELMRHAYDFNITEGDIQCK